MTDNWLEQRLATRRKPSDPDYDAFYDGTDDELARMVPPSREVAHAEIDASGAPEETTP